MPTRFRCKECGIFITAWLEEWWRFDLLKMGDGTPFLPPGFFLFGSRLAQEIPNNPFSNRLLDCVALNISDVQNTVDNEKWIGCCGPDGSVPLTRECLAGHPLGTEISDCWMPHFIYIPLANLHLLEKVR